MKPALLLLLSSILLAAPGASQDTLRMAGAPVAAFDDARALAVDPLGWLYVADAGRGVVYRLDASGAVAATLGGPGSGDGEFDTPSDVEPTNGLVLYVADPGNGRIQRFSRELAFLGVLAPDAADGPAGFGRSSSAYRGGDERRGSARPGRPVAVVSSGANEVFAADADRRVVLKWDRSLRPAATIGDHRAGAGALVEPVALAVDGTRSLFVADRGRRAVVVFDLFGGFVRTLGEGRLDDVRALTVHDGRLWVVEPRRVTVYELSGRLDRTIHVTVGDTPGDALVDLAFHRGVPYLLTASALYVAP